MRRRITCSAPSASSGARPGRDVYLPRRCLRGTATPHIPTYASRPRLQISIARTSSTGTSGCSRPTRITSTATGTGSAARRKSRRQAHLLGALLDGGLAGVSGEDFDRLDVHHLQEAIAAQLASDPTVLHPAERHPRIRLDDAVDEDHPGLDLPREFIGLTEVPRPDARAEAELGVVRLLDRGVQVRHRHHGRDGPERLFAEAAHRVCHLAEKGGFEVPTGPTAPLSPHLDLRAFRNRVFHLAFNLVSLGLADERPHVRRRIERIVHAESPHSLPGLAEARISRGTHQEDTFGGDARLSPLAN